MSELYHDLIGPYLGRLDDLLIAEHPGCSTKELAGLAGIAPASASEHATVLREAGLVQTVRHRNLAVHSATVLGVALLNASCDQSRV